MSDDDFKNRIKAARDAAPSSAYTGRDQVLTRFTAIWQPLIDHIRTLADRHLPADKEISIRFKTEETLKTSLQISLKDVNAASYSHIDELYFTNAGHNKVIGVITGTRPLLDLFRAKARPDYAFALVPITEAQNKFKDVVLHPDKMDQAGEFLENWLASQIAFDFDQDRVYPRSTLEISMKRSGSGPENTPR